MTHFSSTIGCSSAYSVYMFEFRFVNRVSSASVHGLNVECAEECFQLSTNRDKPCDKPSFESIKINERVSSAISVSRAMFTDSWTTFYICVPSNTLALENVANINAFVFTLSYFILYFCMFKITIII